MVIREDILIDKIDSIFERYFKIDKAILNDLKSTQDDLNELIIANFNRLDKKKYYLFIRSLRRNIIRSSIQRFR